MDFLILEVMFIVLGSFFTVGMELRHPFIWFLIYLVLANIVFLGIFYGIPYAATSILTPESLIRGY